ncbi:MAG TPA: hypothetical protein VL856_07930, partial [Acidimicrobiia bacterium]|nr:hypothetical protein [Acidimicrobiia bacterium]
HDIEARLAELFDAQDRAVQVAPREWDNLPLATVTELDERRTRRRWIGGGAAGLAVAGLAAMIALVAGLGGGSHDVVTKTPVGSDGNAKFKFVTEQVSLLADDFSIDANGTHFTSEGAQVDVHSDPGDSAYQTLELTWNEQGVEMRMNIYFAADAHNWWATEIRTYNGQAEGDWIEYMGNRFTTPRGQTFQGDVDLSPDPGQPAGHLHFSNLRLQAFRPPIVCQDRNHKYALHIVGGLEGGIVQVYDTTTCLPLDTRKYTIEANPADPALAAVKWDDVCNEGVPGDVCKRINVTATGSTSVHFTAKENATGDLVAELNVDVTPSGLPRACTQSETQNLLNAIGAYRVTHGANAKPSEADLVTGKLLMTESDQWDIKYDVNGSPQIVGVGACVGSRFAEASGVLK